MFAAAERSHDINDSQYGGRHGHEAAYLPYAEELKYDLCRLSRKPLVNFDNDAQSCYDRIIPSVASLLGRYHGLHPNITNMHADLLQNATFQVKTSLGVSTESYQHSSQFPIYGTGQGSTNSPIIWSMISSKLFDIHHQQAHGASFCTPDRSICVQESAFGFVDDTTCQTNDFMSECPMSVDSLVRTATADAQIWSYLLYISGGLLELPKCSVHIVFQKFYSSGKPYLCKPRVIPPIHLPDPRDLSPIEISCHPPDLEHKTLGHYKAPAGHLPKQRAALHRAADALATMILRSFLFPAEARMVYFAIFLAKFSYVLPQCYFIPSVLRKIESKAQQTFTAKMGFSRKMSCAIRYGPPSLGGLGLVRLETIQGVGQILNFIKHWRSYSYIGSLLRCTLAWAQINAGVSAPLLMIPSLRLAHFESKFIQSLRNYLAAIDATIEVDTPPFVPPCQRENDVYLMDVATSSADFSVSDLRRLNFCRLFLQAVTASDIVLPTRSGDTIDPLYRHGDANLPISPSTTYCPTTQAKPSKGSWNVWRRFCVLLEQQLASTPLGNWIVAGTDLRRSLPLSERQLLSDLEILIPVADLLDVLQQTTSIDNAKCYGVSDGSESSGSMTFGWVIAAPDGTRMVSCAGPAFGSQASSYRAEGYGFVSMALFLFHLRHFSSAIPDWRLTFVSDNLGLVTKTPQSWDYDFPFPNLTLASDYDVIHETVMSLRQARVQASFSHVKGHQDTSKTHFASLPLTAQLNIEADELAGSYRQRHENAVHSRAPLLSHT
eukprot:scaffold4965_cov87-Cylindrotheca_fusiformis.AAC.1